MLNVVYFHVKTHNFMHFTSQHYNNVFDGPRTECKSLYTSLADNWCSAFLTILFCYAAAWCQTLLVRSGNCPEKSAQASFFTWALRSGSGQMSSGNPRTEDLEELFLSLMCSARSGFDRCRRLSEVEHEQAHICREHVGCLFANIRLWWRTLVTSYKRSLKRFVQHLIIIGPQQ